MKFVAKLIDIKTVRSRTVALVSGSVYDTKPTLHSKNMPVTVLHESDGPSTAEVTGPVDIVGYTCMEHDCLYRGFEGPLCIGDYVVFDSVGAYTNVLRPPFINPSPAIVACDDSRHGFECVKRAEDIHDVFAAYVF